MKPPLAQAVRALVGYRTALVATLLSCVAATGCRNDASQRDAYIREIRLHEDQIYELQDCVNEYQAIVRQQRLENRRLRDELGDDGVPEAKRIGDPDRPAERSLLDRPAPPAATDDPDLPDIDMGEPGLPEIDLGEPVPPGEVQDIPSVDLDELSHHSAEGPTRLASATVYTPPARPTKPAESCALYAEQMPLEPIGDGTDEPLGLMAIVEPMTSAGDAGYFAGEVSLMLVDPLASDEEWEIARWDYTPEEVESAWRDSSRRVLDLAIAVPAVAPRGRPLELWVRLLPIDTEGQDTERKILCSTGITLTEQVGLIGVPVSGGSSSTDPTAIVSSGWTAADELGSRGSKPVESKPATWQTATTLPPAAVARAQATGEASRTPRRPPAWSPFRR